MRAKLVLAVSLAISALQPTLASQLTDDVYKILTGNSIRHTVVLSQPAVIQTTAVAAPVVVAAPAACAPAAVIPAIKVMQQPAVIAPTTTGVAILMRDPSDLDIRREQLARQIGQYSASGLISAAKAND